MQFVEVIIPDNIDPLDRGYRFEDPIDAALEQAGIEYEYLGGGSSLSSPEDGMRVMECDFSFEVADLKRALLLIFKVLKDAEAPPDTTIRICEPEERTYRLGDLA